MLVLAARVVRGRSSMADACLPLLVLTPLQYETLLLYTSAYGMALAVLCLALSAARDGVGPVARPGRRAAGRPGCGGAAGLWPGKVSRQGGVTVRHPNTAHRGGRLPNAGPLRRPEGLAGVPGLVHGGLFRLELAWCPCRCRVSMVAQYPSRAGP